MGGRRRLRAERQQHLGSQVLGKGAVKEGFTEEVTLELSQAKKLELTRQ